MDHTYDIVFLFRVDGVCSAHFQSKVERALEHIDGNHFRTSGFRNHDRRESDAPAPVHGDPVPGRHVSLIHDGPKGGPEPTSKTRSRHGIDVPWQLNEIGVGIVNGDLLGEGAPGRKPGLELIRTHLRVARFALGTPATALNEGDCHSVSGTPLLNVCPHLSNDARQLVPRHVRRVDQIVVALPSVPVAPAKSTGLHVNHDAPVRRRGRRNLPHLRLSPKVVVDNGSHTSGLQSSFSQTQ